MACGLIRNDDVHVFGVQPEAIDGCDVRREAGGGVWLWGSWKRMLSGPERSWMRRICHGDRSYLCPPGLVCTTHFTELL